MIGTARRILNLHGFDFRQVLLRSSRCFSYVSQLYKDKTSANQRMSNDSSERHGHTAVLQFYFSSTLVVGQISLVSRQFQNPTNSRDRKNISKNYTIELYKYSRIVNWVSCHVKLVKGVQRKAFGLLESSCDLQICSHVSAHRETQGIPKAHRRLHTWPKGSRRTERSDKGLTKETGWDCMRSIHNWHKHNKQERTGKNSMAMIDDIILIKSNKWHHMKLTCLAATLCVTCLVLEGSQRRVGVERPIAPSGAWFQICFQNVAKCVPKHWQDLR